MQGKNAIYSLTDEEYNAAMAAIKLVRGDVIKKSFFEGYRDGFRDGGNLYKGARMVGEFNSWERSHAKMLSDATVDSNKPGGDSTK